MRQRGPNYKCIPCYSVICHVLQQQEPPVLPVQSRSTGQSTSVEAIQGDERSISFNAQVETGEAASTACLGPARDIRERTPTGFIQDVQVDGDDRSVKFGNNVSFVHAASSGAAPGQARDIRERTPTGFIAEDSALTLAGDRNISFSPQVESVDAASRACLGPVRDIRDRTPTGFIQDVQQEEEKSVKFGSDVSFLQAASSQAPPGQQRSIRDRTPTGFITEDSELAQTHDRNISFNVQVETGDAASKACLGPARDIRERTPTGFIPDVPVDMEGKSVTFGSDVSFVRAASSEALPGQARSISERTPTGFITIPGDPVLTGGDDRNISFSAKVEMVDAASKACLGPPRDVRDRTPTGFIQDFSADGEEKSVKFGNDVAVVEAASSEALAGQARRVSERIPTGFVSEDVTKLTLAEDRSISFSPQVESVDAASRACLGPVRDIRDRTPTGFIQDVQQEEEKSVKFGSDVSFLQAASSQAPPGQQRSIRDRTPTGFITEDSELAQTRDRNISFNVQVETGDAASKACLGPARDIRERTPTGFVQDVQVDGDDRSVKFGNNVSFVHAASSGAAPGQARDIRERTPTGFIAEDSALTLAGDRNISFSPQVESVDAASRACLGPVRDIRDRTPTGFIQDVQQEEEKSVKFGSDVSFLQAASSQAPPGQQRSIRDRTPTGFITEDSELAQTHDRNISFNVQVETGDAASKACLGPARDIRERTPTGFIPDVPVDMEGKSVTFGSDVSFVRAASSEALPGQARSISERTPTGFITIPGDPVLTGGDDRNISFSATVEMVDAASKACLGPPRDVRDRTPTGFIQDFSADGEEKSVKFGNDVAVVEAASSEALAGQARRVSERIPTGFISEDVTKLTLAEDRSISFSPQVESVDAASRACLGPVRDIRDRTPTGFIQDVQQEEEKSVKFGSDVSFVQAASSEALPGQARSISERTPTGFITIPGDPVLTGGEDRNISFSAKVEMVDAASKACLGPPRDVRDRTPTGFIPDVPVDMEGKSVTFGSDVSFVRAASSEALPGQARSISERTPTGFITIPGDPVLTGGDDRNISFSAKVEMVDAASKACLGPPRDVRDRTPTGFIQDVSADGEEKSVKFGNDVAVVEAASSEALAGQARRVSERIPTGFISEDVTKLTLAEDRSISFSPQVESVDAASRACLGPVRDIRDRTPTGFIQDVQQEEEKSVKFGSDVSFVQAASSEALPGQARSISERTPTGFITIPGDPVLTGGDDRNISFSAKVEMVDAASKACLGPPRDVRDRTPTGFIQDVSADGEEKSIKFGNDADVVESLDLRPDFSVSFSAQVDDRDAASRGCTGPASDDRQRTPTGFTHLEEVLPGEASHSFDWTRRVAP